MHATTVAIDLAKDVFELAFADVDHRILAQIVPDTIFVFASIFDSSKSWNDSSRVGRSIWAHADLHLCRRADADASCNSMLDCGRVEAAWRPSAACWRSIWLMPQG